MLPDSTQAVFFWELAKSNGDINASYSLAVATYRGEGIEADKTSAINQLEELVEQNHAHAKYSLAKALLDSDDRTPELEKRALDLYESAAKGGVIRALNNVGNMYASGVGTAQDDITARKWYEAAAEMADPLSMFTLGTWCNTGRGGKEVDFESGFKWNELAAMGGMPKAQFNLGFHFMMGQGTDKVILLFNPLFAIPFFSHATYCIFLTLFRMLGKPLSGLKWPLQRECLLHVLT